MPKGILKSSVTFTFPLLDQKPVGNLSTPPSFNCLLLTQHSKGATASSSQLSSNKRILCRAHKILESKGVNFFQILKEYRQEPTERIFANVLVNGVVQVAIVDVLRLVCLSPVRYFGSSIGTIFCAYAEDVLTLEQTVLLLLYLALELDKVGATNEVNPHCHQVDYTLSSSRLTSHRCYLVIVVTFLKTPNASLNTSSVSRQKDYFHTNLPY